MVVTPRGVYLSSQNGSLYRFDPNLKLKARAVQEQDREGRPPSRPPPRRSVAGGD
jgi:hypothetical protein